jgi:hypothetical protein
MAILIFFGTCGDQWYVEYGDQAWREKDSDSSQAVAQEEPFIDANVTDFDPIFDYLIKVGRRNSCKRTMATSLIFE